MIFKNIFIRNIDADLAFENFLISAISSVLVIRFYLKIFGYPQLGGGNVHVAHVLFGGFFMLIAIFLFIGFLNKSIYLTASIIGGIGFGFFVDELGKFLTRNNDYFFQPAIAIIYFVFVIMYFAIRLLTTYRGFGEKEYIVNALHIAEDGISLGLKRHEKRRALQMLTHIKRNKRGADYVEHLLNLAELIESEPNFFGRAQRYLEGLIDEFLKSKYLPKVLVVFFLMHSAFSFIKSLAVEGHYLRFSDLSFSVTEWLEVLSVFASAVFIVGGIIQLRISMLSGLKMFKAAVLVSILLTQFFSFYEDQFSAILGLGFNIAVLMVLNEMIKKSERSIV